MKKNRFSIKTLFASVLLSGASMVSFAQITDLPVMDGDGSETAWDVATTFDIVNVITDKYISDANDLSGTVKVLWSADSVYVLATVLDDSLYSTITGGNAYQNDNIGIFFDLLNQKTSAYVDTTQFYYEKNWYDNGLGSRFGANWATPPVGDWAIAVDNGVSYTIEISFAWSRFGVTPSIGDEVGFDVKLSDNDGDGVTDGEGRCQLAWRDQTDNGYQWPKVFGTITLAADGSVTGQNSFLPTVDGTSADIAWAAVKAVGITSVISNDNNSNAADLSGTFKTIWTADSMYVLCNVKDDSLYSTITGANAFQNDNIGIFFDLLNQKTSSYVDTTQFYYEKNWYDNGLGSRFGADWATPPFGDWAISVDTGSAYTIEISYGWDQFGVYPGEGDTIGFDIKLSDNDGDGATPAAGRDQLTYMDITDGGWGNPSVFGELLFTANGAAKAISVRPAAPGGLTLAAVDTVVTVSWTAIATAAGYNVYRGTTLIAEGITELTVSDTVASPVDSIVIKYAVRSVDANDILSNASKKSITVYGSGIDAVQDNVLAGLKVYPVPATEFVNITTESEILSVAVYNVTGQVVAQVNNLSTLSYKLDLNNLNSGMYFVKVSTTNGVGLVKVTKQ